jgi:hypothetical protein
MLPREEVVNAVTVVVPKDGNNRNRNQNRDGNNRNRNGNNDEKDNSGVSTMICKGQQLDGDRIHDDAHS